MFLLVNPNEARTITFENEMRKALTVLEQSQSQDDLEKSAQNFIQLQKTHEDEWLPSYYAVTSYLRLSMEYGKTIEEKDAFIKQAEAHMNYLTKHFSTESEVWVLKSWYYASYLMADPMARGMKYGAMSTEATQKALLLAPNNPRAQYLNFQNILGRAPYTYEDTSSLCSDISESLAKFDDYPLKSDIYPSWGKEELTELKANCKN